jgi:hypothetical protein
MALADLMDISQRQKTASELNAAILSSQCQVRHLAPCLSMMASDPCAATVEQCCMLLVSIQVLRRRGSPGCQAY